MTHTILYPTATEFFAGLLKGDPIPWSALRMAPDEFLHACSDRGLTSLIGERLRSRLPEHCDWPQDICDTLATMAREQTAKELLREKELISVLDVLVTEDICPIILKGTALAYSLYNSPASRPRVDTDLLIRKNEIDAVRRVMAGCGYTAPTYCEGDLLF